MKSLQFYGKQDIRLEEIPVPQAGPGEIVVKIGAALTCGTDFKAFRQGHRVLLKNAPCGFGHEGAGTVYALGSGVDRFKVGDRVVAANSAPCDRCFFCRRGQSNLCDNLELLNGTYAEYLKVPANIVRHNAYKIPSSVSWEEAALAEPLACVLHAVDHLSIKPGEEVCLIGAGTMAALTVVVLKERGARVSVVGRGQEHLERAKRLGTSRIWSVESGDPVQEVFRCQDLNQARGFDCVIEAVGKPETWELSMRLARKGGRVCLFAGCEIGSSISVDTHRMHYQEITLTGVFHHTPRYFAEAVRLLAAQKIPLEEFVTGRISLDQAKELFEKHAATPVKVAVVP